MLSWSAWGWAGADERDVRAKGVELSRQGGSVDNKVNLVKWVLDYNAKYGCPANQV